jgi:hypothetical protein
VISKSLFAAASLILFTAVAQADADTLEPITFGSVRADLKKSLKRPLRAGRLIPILDSVTTDGPVGESSLHYRRLATNTAVGSNRIISGVERSDAKC